MTRDRIALVTGATGYIGGHVVDRLAAAGWRVHALVRAGRGPNASRGCETAQAYDGSPDSIAAALATTRPTVVFHLAAAFQTADRSAVSTDDIVRSNILFPTQLVDAMVRAGCTRLVNTGTFWQHAGADGDEAFDLYAASKQALEVLLRHFHDTQRLSCLTLKLYDTYGAADSRRKLLSLLIRAAQTGEMLDLSPGDQVLDLTHVADVAAAFQVAGDVLLASEHPLRETAFVSGERLSVKALAEQVEAALGKPVPTRFGARPYRNREVMLPIVPAPSTVLHAWRRERSLHEEIPILAAG